MDLRNITYPTFQRVLVHCALSMVQHKAVAHILESNSPASEAYPQLKAELTRMHQKSSWDQLGELFALPPCGGRKGTELLVAMEPWFRWQYFSCLPNWVQRQLAEDTSPVRELAKRVDELQRTPAEGAGGGHT